MASKASIINILPRFLAFVGIWCVLQPGLAQSADETKYRVNLEARLSSDEPPITDGLEWRIFKTVVDDKGELPLLSSVEGGTRSFDMTPGQYYIHVGYGYAGVAKLVEIKQEENTIEFILNAGGLQLQAITSPDGPIVARQLRFDIFSEEVDERGVRHLIARDVRPLQIVAFNVGTYHVVSHYGNLNAETRADLRIQAGKLTQATLQHRAAQIKFSLVRKLGGSAIADTSWSILAENGDVIKESNSTFPTLILSEGNYTAIARNAEKIYSHDFVVASGRNQAIEVLVE